MVLRQVTAVAQLSADPAAPRTRRRACRSRRPAGAGPAGRHRPPPGRARSTCCSTRARPPSRPRSASPACPPGRPGTTLADDWRPAVGRHVGADPGQLGRGRGQAEHGGSPHRQVFDHVQTVEAAHGGLEDVGGRRGAGRDGPARRRAQKGELRLSAGQAVAPHLAHGSPTTLELGHDAVQQVGHIGVGHGPRTTAWQGSVRRNLVRRQDLKCPGDIGADVGQDGERIVGADAIVAGDGRPRCRSGGRRGMARWSVAGGHAGPEAGTATGAWRPGLSGRPRRSGN